MLCTILNERFPTLRFAMTRIFSTFSHYSVRFDRFYFVKLISRYSLNYSILRRLQVRFFSNRIYNNFLPSTRIKKKCKRLKLLDGYQRAVTSNHAHAEVPKETHQHAIIEHSLTLCAFFFVCFVSTHVITIDRIFHEPPERVFTFF